MDTLWRMRDQIRHRFEQLCRESPYIPHFFSKVDNPELHVDPGFNGTKAAIAKQGGMWDFVLDFPRCAIGFEKIEIPRESIEAFEYTNNVENVPSIDMDIRRCVAQFEHRFRVIPMCKLMLYQSISAKIVHIMGIEYSDITPIYQFTIVCWVMSDKPELETREDKFTRLVYIQECEQSGQAI